MQAADKHHRPKHTLPNCTAGKVALIYVRRWQQIVSYWWLREKPCDIKKTLFLGELKDTVKETLQYCNAYEILRLCVCPRRTFAGATESPGQIQGHSDESRYPWARPWTEIFVSCVTFADLGYLILRTPVEEISFQHWIPEFRTFSPTYWLI